MERSRARVSTHVTGGERPRVAHGPPGACLAFGNTNAR